MTKPEWNSAVQIKQGRNGYRYNEDSVLLAYFACDAMGLLGDAHAGDADAGNAHACGANAGDVEACGANAGDADAGDADAGGANAGNVDACDVDAGDVDACGANAGDVDACGANAGDANACGANAGNANACDVDACDAMGLLGDAHACDADAGDVDAGNVEACGANACDADACDADAGGVIRLADMGAGCGVISLLVGYVAAKAGTPVAIDAVEVQGELFAYLQANTLANEASGVLPAGSIAPVLSDIRHFHPRGRDAHHAHHAHNAHHAHHAHHAHNAGISHPCYDYIVCNPPYRNVGGGRMTPNRSKGIACFAGEGFGMTLVDLFDFAAKHLHATGSLFVSYPSARFDYATGVAHEYGFAARAVRPVYEFVGCDAGIVLVEFARKGVRALPRPLSSPRPLPLVKRVAAGGVLSREYRHIYRVFAP